AKSEEVTEGKVLGAFILAATEYEKLYQDNTVLFEKDLAPAYSLNKGDEIECTASGSGASIAYQWYKDGVAVEGAQSSKVVPTKSGTYYCAATADGITVKTSASAVTVDGETSLTPLHNSQFTIYNSDVYNVAGQKTKKGSKGIKVAKGSAVLY
ncbi:MAG: immunoglobulin domain-containing protein, partial [Prevotella sp.]|nr:immunoglobulin domain-containing protein [Prevotella sp.]